MDQKLDPLKIYMCAPRGFCAGVDRAIQIVELALKKYGAPVHVRHEIVHNRYVVDDLNAKGAIFVETLSEIPDSDKPVIFSAHGVPKSVPKKATEREMFFLDATCPLVSKVHAEAEQRYLDGCDIILIGHKGHPEVIGTMGQLPDGVVRLIETPEQAREFKAKHDGKLAYITQTTLSIDDTAEIVSILKGRFPDIIEPKRADICYATTNRQEAVKAIATKCDALIVVGAPNSSNSLRLVEVAERAGCSKALLLQRADDIDWSYFAGIKTLGITAGASAPEILVEEVLNAFIQHYDVDVETITTARESVAFKLPRQLRKSPEE